MRIISPNRIVVAVIAVMLFTLHFAVTAAADHEVTKEVQQQLNKLDETADEMYEAAKNNAWDQTREHIGQLKEWIPQIKYEGITDIEGMNALTEAALSAEYTLNQVQLSGQEVMVAAARLRLAADALTHPHQPMWLQYFKWFQEGAEQMETALQINNPVKFAESVKQVQGYYDIVRPSMLINRDRELIVRMDSLLHYLQQVSQNDTYNKEELSNVIMEYKSTANELFERTSQDTYTEFRPTAFPIGGMITFGAFILAVLAVAGWRIYRYEKLTGFVPVKRKTRDY